MTLRNGQKLYTWLYSNSKDKSVTSILRKLFYMSNSEFDVIINMKDEDIIKDL